ncbi:MAG TPA: M91 family zinc metallopeptidase [Polyangiaceae bacterium]|nr:M91 family zinc metallopeptidase [Polyangiaceae bacterium]
MMLTRAEFVNELTRTNRDIYLGAPSKVRTQSSMLATVNAVAAFEASGTGANLLALMRTVGAVPQVKKNRYTNALNALYQSFPSPIYVTMNPLTISLAMVNGIGVPRSNNVPSHQVDVLLALQELHNTGSGNALLAAICAEVNKGGNGNRVAIGDAVGTMSGGNECQIVGKPPDDYQTELAAALVGDHSKVGAKIDQALTKMGKRGQYEWLQERINNEPIWQLQGEPSTVGSASVNGNNWISVEMLKSWTERRSSFPAPLKAGRASDAQVVLGAILHPGATPGPGGSTKVRWSAANLMAAGAARPPCVGLAHELVHALHNMRGDQPGNDNGHPTTALFEYICVGLGPWHDEPNTENAVREGIPCTRRPYYAPGG